MKYFIVNMISIVKIVMDEKRERKRNKEQNKERKNERKKHRQ